MTGSSFCLVCVCSVTFKDVFFPFNRFLVCFRFLLAWRPADAIVSAHFPLLFDLIQVKVRSSWLLFGIFFRLVPYSQPRLFAGSFVLSLVLRTRPACTPHFSLLSASFTHTVWASPDRSRSPSFRCVHPEPVAYRGLFLYISSFVSFSWLHGDRCTLFALVPFWLAIVFLSAQLLPFLFQLDRALRLNARCSPFKLKTSKLRSRWSQTVADGNDDNILILIFVFLFPIRVSHFCSATLATKIFLCVCVSY